MSSAAEASRRGFSRDDVRRGQCYIRTGNTWSVFAVYRKGWVVDGFVDAFAHLWQAESIANAINEGRRRIDSYNGWAIVDWDRPPDVRKIP